MDCRNVTHRNEAALLTFFEAQAFYESHKCTAAIASNFPLGALIFAKGT